MASTKCAHCQLTDEDSLVNQIITASNHLPKFHPHLAEKEIELGYEPTVQEIGVPEDRKLLSDLMISYGERGFNLDKLISGENVVNFALKYRLNSQVIATLLDRGAPAQDYDDQMFTPFRVALLDLPYSKTSLMTLLRHGIDMDSEEIFETYDQWDKRHPLLIMCSRSPDLKTAEILKAYLCLDEAMPGRGGLHSHNYESLMHSALHKAIDNKAHTEVIKVLVDYDAPIQWGIRGIPYSVVGRAVLSKRPDTLRLLLENDAAVKTRGMIEINPLFACIEQGIDSCRSDYTLEQVLGDANYQCMCILLADGCYVNEIGCRNDSMDKIYKYWKTEEAKFRGYKKPKVLTAMSAFYKRKTGNERRRPDQLTSYIDIPEYPSIYFLLLALEKLVDAGALPNRGELPKDIIEWIFTKYSVSDDEKLREAVLIVFNKLLAAGFDLFIDDFADRYVVSRTEVNPEWTMPDDEAHLLERLREIHFQPKSLMKSSLIFIRKDLAKEDKITRKYALNPETLWEKLEDWEEPPPIIKHQISLKNLPSLSDLWQDKLGSPPAADQ